MLTEDSAWALLEQHCRPLREAEWADAEFQRRDEWADATRERVDLVVRSPDNTSHKNGYNVGARVRLALAVAHAVSSCRGFEPATHQAFWRRVVHSLWRKTEFHHHARHALAWSPMTFAHVGVLWYARSKPDPIEAFWRGFFHGNPTSQAKLRAVLRQLRPYLPAEAPPPLRVSLPLCIGISPNESELPSAARMECIVMPEVLRTILGVALATPARAWATALHLGLVVEYRIGDDTAAVEQTLDLLQRAARTTATSSVRFSIDRLAIQLAPPTAPRRAHKAPRRASPGTGGCCELVTRGRALARVLRGLLLESTTHCEVNTVALFGCSYSDFRHVGAALSAVVAASPAVAELRCRALLDGIQPHGRQLRLAWLIYALRCRHRQASVPRSLSLLANAVALDHLDLDYVEQLVARGTPLRDVVLEALRLRCGGDRNAPMVECLRLGSTVRLARGTPLYFEPMRGTTEYEAVTLADTAELDWIACVAGGESVIGVVYAAYGLVWADERSVLARYRVENDESAMAAVDTDRTDSDMGCAISSLSLGFEDAQPLPSAIEQVAHRITSALPMLIGPSLHSLAIDRAIVTRADLTCVLRRCPRLASLQFYRCAIESLEPLIDAYRCRSHRLASLSLRCVRAMYVGARLVDYQVLNDGVLTTDGAPCGVAALLEPLVEALERGDARGVLRDLRVDVNGVRSKAAQRELVERLARGCPSLVRLHITCLWPLQRVCKALLAPLQDVILPDPPRVRCAVVSVLRAFNCAMPEIAQAIVRLAQGSTVRTVTWGIA